MERSHNPSPKLPCVWVICASLILCLCTLLTYYPGLSGDYEFDDTSNILENRQLAIDKLNLTNIYQASTAGGFAGPLKRPISIATFVLNRYATGLDPYYMKLTNVIIHMANSLAIFLLSYLLLKTYFEANGKVISKRNCQWLALAITATWTLHPLALTSNLYTVQRMTSLSALFCTLGLISFMIARQRMCSGRKGLLLFITGFVIFGALSIFSKENGGLLPVFMFIIEITFFNFNTSNKKQKQFLYSFFIATLAIPAVMLAGKMAISPDWLLGGYATRDFNLIERILTEARVLWFYIYLIILPNISQMGIYHDDIPLSYNLLTPWTTLPAMLGIILLLLTAILKRKSLPVLSFGILFFFAGHSLESTIFPLEIAHEHRNYLPMFGIIFSLIIYLINPFLHPQTLRLRTAIAGAFIVLLAATTTVRASYWGDLLEHAIMESNNHPLSGRAQFQTGRIYWKLAMNNPASKEAFFRETRKHFEKAATISAHKSAALLSLIHLSFFAEFGMEEQWLDELLTELRSSPFPSGASNMLHIYTLCQITKPCALSESQMRSIFDAALSNPTLKGSVRSSVLSTAGLYSATLQDFNSALKYLNDAVKFAEGDLVYRLTLIDLLTKLGRYADARQQLAIIKSEDTLKAYTRRITTAENTLVNYESMPDSTLEKE